MEQETIRSAVRGRYGAIARGEASGCGCGPGCCDGEAEALASLGLGYTEEELSSIPKDADLGLGSGHPTAAADLRPGETVLDLGSGGGIDCFLAAGKVGPKGYVIGVDMTPDMVARARENARKGDLENVEFRLGEIEALPVADASVDVVISNCVLNLSTERQRALQEAFRVLKPGGRLVISDLVSDTRPPAVLEESLEIMSGCLPVPQHEYVASLEAAGFSDVTITRQRPFAAEQMPVDNEALERLEAGAVGSGELTAYASSARSAILTAHKA
jgi:SAM-dependent methyltransferase